MTPQELNEKIAEKAAEYVSQGLPVPSNYDLERMINEDDGVQSPDTGVVVEDMSEVNS